MIQRRSQHEEYWYYFFGVKETQKELKLIRDFFSFETLLDRKLQLLDATFGIVMILGFWKLFFSRTAKKKKNVFQDEKSQLISLQVTNSDG